MKEPLLGEISDRVLGKICGLSETSGNKAVLGGIKTGIEKSKGDRRPALCPAVLQPFQIRGDMVGAQILDDQAKPQLSASCRNFRPVLQCITQPVQMWPAARLHATRKDPADNWRTVVGCHGWGSGQRQKSGQHHAD